ncbi:unnamed protein product [Penicillium roqueforti FM164]|uniref:Genomic scaffold, ProqFM164S01 n=1 Tax=Penicillium roqueforti (strain FM164) TaxID=1365484 RepID=W6PSE7_PENRF|nr:unnamed protein product [Penicillium roqueforti FM164]
MRTILVFRMRSVHLRLFHTLRIQYYFKTTPLTALPFRISTDYVRLPHASFVDLT